MIICLSVGKRAASQNLKPIIPTMHLGLAVTSLEAIIQINCSFLWSHKKGFTTFST